MSYYSYFESHKNVLKDQADGIVEELDITGFSVVPNVLPAGKTALLRECLDEAWAKQVAETGEKTLKEMGEWGTARALLFYRKEFGELIRHPLVMEVVKRTVGETAILHLMNGSIAFPSTDYHQGMLHRDFAKNFSSDRMLSVNAFWVLDRFDEKTGATWFVPFTQKIPYTPSDEYVARHGLQVTADPGSILFFDSRIYHRAGVNKGKDWRRGLNFQYTKPFIKQQMDYPVLFKDTVERESPLGQTLGMWTVPPKNVPEFRVEPSKRTYKGGQG